MNSYRHGNSHIPSQAEAHITFSDFDDFNPNDTSLYCIRAVFAGEDLQLCNNPKRLSWSRCFETISYASKLMFGIVFYTFRRLRMGVDF